ncbi:MAG: NADH-quinone oxidoreductase subunit C [Limnochordaceae bacterium]|nr:NADH-quinone oxidoreductase subunit C [Limnochordaceae bacterium]
MADELLQRLAERWPQDVELLPSSPDTPVLRVRAGALKEVARFLREQGYRMLLDVGGVDYLGHRPAEERFEVVYHLLDVHERRRLRLRVPLPEQDPRLDTVSDLWPSANWAEREVFDLFGIRFEGHPNLKRILMPDDWQGHPLRKDYPLRGPERSRQPQALRSRFAPLKLGAEEDGR